jgi:hypothetical protein
LLDVVELGAAAGLFPEDVVDVLEGLLEHAAVAVLDVRAERRVMDDNAAARAAKSGKPKAESGLGRRLRIADFGLWIGGGMGNDESTNDE